MDQPEPLHERHSRQAGARQHRAARLQIRKRKHARKKFMAVLEETLDGTGNMQWVAEGQQAAWMKTMGKG